MRFVIRADASAKIGAGHVMRCCAIAEELIHRGEEVIFIGEIESLPWLQARVNGWGFTHIYNRVSGFAPNSVSDLLILDSYEINPDDSFLERRKWRNIVAIVDDVTPEYRADLYIHPGIETAWRPPAGAQDSLFMSGVEYIPVRKSIREIVLKKEPGQSTSPVTLVIGGGSDPFDFCGFIGEVLHKLTEEFKATFFANAKTSIQSDPRFAMVPIGSKVEEYLAIADLVFTTAGTSSWEVLSCGLPIGLAQAVENQSANYLFQTRANIAMGIGFRDEDNRWQLSQDIIKKLIKDSDFRMDLAKRTRTIVDGKGAARIVDAILLGYSR